MTEISVEPFVNSIGQTLNPGDEVVAVTTGFAHNVNVFTGIYRGVRHTTRYGKAHVKVVIDGIPDNYDEYVFCDDGVNEEFTYKYNPGEGYTSVPTGRRYNIVEVERKRKTTLNLNRVFKIDTKAMDIKV